VRIISGSARGIQIHAPKGREIRPTLDRVRESVFNILTPYIDEDCVVADLFCGTGANALEALSRGSARAVLADSNAEAMACARANAEKARLQERCLFKRSPLPERLPSVLDIAAPYHIIYADPPFSFTDYDGILNAIAAPGTLASDGIAVIEHSSRVELSQQVDTLCRNRQENYGETSVSFYRLDVG